MTNKKTALQFLCSVLLIITSAADTITSGRPLRDGETVVSAAGIYELGFFDGGDSASRFVGIWYKKISTRTIVWVANRNSPLNDTSGALMINENGNLVLVGGANNRTIWSSNSSRISENPVAWLSDGGNLVIKDEKGNFAWQSFDHPGNTLLPGMKLGRNLVNGLDWSISAWKTADDPSPGEYRASLDINGYPQLFVNKGSVLQYSSGPWDGMAFTGSPVLKPDTYFTFKLVITSDEVYYTYEVKNTSLPTRAVIIPTGVVQHLTWIERTQIWSVYLTAQLDNCDRYGLCGPYASCSINNSPPCDCLRGFQPKFPAQWNGADWSSGCERRAPLVCGEKDGFREFSGIKMPDSRHSWYDKNIDLKECKKRCLENCSCTAYSNLDVTDGSGCLLYFSELMDLRELSQNEQTLYVRVAASEVDADKNQKKRRLMRIIIGPTVIGTLLICVFCWCASKRRTKRGLVDDKDMELPLFDLATVSSATKNFSAKNMIGEGGFGPVYKGKLASGQEIAVKRLSKHSVQGVQELKAEVNLISKLQHRNLVKLLGCCIEGEEGILVYEFMPNNSLDHFIFDPSRKAELGWQKRFEIVMGISRGLLYLHQDSRLRIIHRDLKASNILLDNNFLPKISDFGLARIVGLDQNEGKTKRVVGTYGYMSPEYAIDGEFSVKSDVFSLGVLILELVSGRKNRTFRNSDHLHNLLGHAWILWKEGRAMEIMDESLEEESCVKAQVLRCIQVGLLCVQKLPGDRPNMASVVFMLGNEDVHLAEPKEPGFFVERGSTESGRVTENTETLTILEAR